MNLRELSRQLNLSQTTVSRALNGYPEVSEQTRKRVTEAARRYNYSPNARARTLATGRTMSIGHIIPMSKQNELVNMVFTDFIAGAGLVYAQQGYDMTLRIVADDGKLAAYRSFAERGAVDGVIVQSPTRDDPRIDYLAALDIPFLVHGRASEITKPYPWLDVNSKRAIETATRHLIELGHRRIGLVNGHEVMDFASRRREGYCAALTAAGLVVDEALTRSGDMSEPNGYEAARDLLAQQDAPTAFVASSIVMALGVKRAVEDRGLRIGRDVSVVCFDDDISFLPNAGETPLFTAMRSSVRAAGQRCATLLIERIKAPQAPPPTELWEAELIRGTSSGPGPFA
ncbi:LacI family DNA-binding transcriptional regulator [Roseobacter weihaiensis]|uniref:LacI family DNA-binding transcriptional regulator n=1 Tax=Roseobacter weihaiensis TaxID=2763262 RepID=UPI001D0B124F|nr:substrate-binding domain-containing protein [Roseobacter sp. H9]